MKTNNVGLKNAGETFILDKYNGMTGVFIKFFGVMAFSLLTAAGAGICIPLPFTPVPLSLQTFFVLSSGLFLGSGLGALSQANYLLLGIIGLPVFTHGGAGFEKLLGPTGGYLLGFIISAFMSGKILKTGRLNSARVAAAVFSGTFLILVCGTIQLAIVMKYSMVESFMKGFLPFIYGDIIKALVLFKAYSIYKRRDLSSVGRAVGS